MPLSGELANTPLFASDTEITTEHEYLARDLAYEARNAATADFGSGQEAIYVGAQDQQLYANEKMVPRHLRTGGTGDPIDTDNGPITVQTKKKSDNLEEQEPDNQNPLPDVDANTETVDQVSLEAVVNHSFMRIGNALLDIYNAMKEDMKRE